VTVVLIGLADKIS